MDQVPPKAEMDSLKYSMENGVHYGRVLQYLPLFLVQKLLREKMLKALNNRLFTDAYRQAALNYISLHAVNLGKQDCVLGKIMKFPAFM